MKRLDEIIDFIKKGKADGSLKPEFHNAMVNFGSDEHGEPILRPHSDTDYWYRQQRSILDKFSDSFKMSEFKNMLFEKYPSVKFTFEGALNDFIDDILTNKWRYDTAKEAVKAFIEVIIPEIKHYVHFMYPTNPDYYEHLELKLTYEKP